MGVDVMKIRLKKFTPAFATVTTELIGPLTHRLTSMELFEP
jgi:hypothetical protein